MCMRCTACFTALTCLFSDRVTNSHDVCFETEALALSILRQFWRDKMSTVLILEGLWAHRYYCVRIGDWRLRSEIELYTKGTECRSLVTYRWALWFDITVCETSDERFTDHSQYRVLRPPTPAITDRQSSMTLATCVVRSAINVVHYASAAVHSLLLLLHICCTDEGIRVAAAQSSVYHLCRWWLYVIANQSQVRHAGGTARTTHRAFLQTQCSARDVVLALSAPL